MNSIAIPVFNKAPYDVFLARRRFVTSIVLRRITMYASYNELRLLEDFIQLHKEFVFGTATFCSICSDSETCSCQVLNTIFRHICTKTYASDLT